MCKTQSTHDFQRPLCSRFRISSADFSLFLHTTLKKKHANAHTGHVQTPNNLLVLSLYLHRRALVCSQACSACTSDYRQQVDGSSHPRREKRSCFCQTAGTPLRTEVWTNTNTLSTLDDWDCRLHFVGQIKYLLSITFI